MIPLPKISHTFFFINTLTPNFLTAFIEAMTSSDISKFFDLEIPLPIDENKTQRVAGYLTPGERPRSYKLDALPYNINYTGEMQDGAKHLRDFYQYKENMPLQNVLLLRSRKSVSLSNAIKDPISEFIESAITQPLDAFKKETEREINTSAIQSFVIRVVGVILLGVFVMSVSSTLTSEYIRDKFRKKNGEKKQIKNR